MEEDPVCCALAGGAMSKLVAKLDGRSHGRRRCTPIPWEVKNVLMPVIKQNLESMMAIIQDDGHDNSSREVIRCLTKEARELSYDIHDCLDEHAAGPASDQGTRLLRRMERHVRVANDKRRRSTVLARRRTSIKPISTWLSEKLKGRLWLLEKMREISARSEEALRRYTSFNHPLKKQRKDDDHGDGSTSSSTTRSRESFGPWSPPPYADVVHRRIVGINDLALNTIEAWIKDGEYPNLRVMSIVGRGGVGKTTLANELYRRTRGQFKCHAFVRTSHKPDVRRLLISILSQIRPQQPPVNWTAHNPIADIRTHLQDKRYLIVIDDVWARSTWDIVNSAFLDGNHCSRILITSELEDVALKCCGYEPQYVYKMKPLSESDSRKLFCNIVGSPQELTEVSDSIIRKCGGLPLAIVTIASLVAGRMGKAEQRDYVDYVDKSLGYGLMTNPTLEGMKQVINLSYSNLPQHLKACMLYLCIFPGDCIIWMDDLVKQWIAEGFIRATAEKDAEEISRSYFDELISSRLIYPVHIDGNDEVLSCTMHHMVRNHIMHESVVENFVAAIDHSQTATRFVHKVRRLSLQFGSAEDATLSTNMRLSQVRTLAFFGDFKCVPSITKFRLLQVLILQVWGDEGSISFDLTSISDIFRLRYLQVTCNVILKIQQLQMLQHLQYLETLKIDAARGSTILSDIVHLPHLLHLRLPAETNFLSGIGHMTSLRTLGQFDLSTNSIEEVRNLGELTNVQELQLTCTPRSPCYLVKQVECLSLVLGKLNNLKCLTLKPSSIVDVGHQPSSISISCDGLGRVSSPPAHLEKLEWLPRVCTFSSLPEWIGHLGKLRNLKIGVRELVRNDVDLLKGLPALTVLSLYVRTEPAERIVFSKGGFLVLRYFRFRCSVPCLKFEEQAMPNLWKLKLGFDAYQVFQYSLIPAAGLAHLSSLKEFSAKIGGASDNEEGRRIAESELRDAIRMHSGRPRVNIQCADQMFGDKDDQNIRLQEPKPLTSQRQNEPIEEESNEQYVALQKGSRDDATGRSDRGSLRLYGHDPAVHRRSRRRRSVGWLVASMRTGVLEDGHNWRKYGQKDVLGSKHPISYYRCANKATHGCNATRKVQRTNEDPLLFDITYSENHTCILGVDLLPRPKQEQSFSPMAIKAAEESVAASSSSPGQFSTSSFMSAAASGSMITHKTTTTTTTSDSQQEDSTYISQADIWRGDSDDADSSDSWKNNSTDSDFDQVPQLQEKDNAGSTRSPASSSVRRSTSHRTGLTSMDADLGRRRHHQQQQQEGSSSSRMLPRNAPISDYLADYSTASKLFEYVPPLRPEIGSPDRRFLLDSIAGAGRRQGQHDAEEADDAS